MKTPQLTFRKHEFIEPGLLAGEPVCIKLLKPNVLTGAFAVDHSHFDKTGLKRPHRALVITLTCKGYNESRNLIGGALTFPDDVDDEGEKVVGYFTIKLDTLLNMNLNEPGFVTVSLGHDVSNTVEVQPIKPGV